MTRRTNGSLKLGTTVTLRNQGTVVQYFFMLKGGLEEKLRGQSVCDETVLESCLLERESYALDVWDASILHRRERAAQLVLQVQVFRAQALLSLLELLLIFRKTSFLCFQRLVHFVPAKFAIVNI